LKHDGALGYLVYLHCRKCVSLDCWLLREKETPKLTYFVMPPKEPMERLSTFVRPRKTTPLPVWPSAEKYTVNCWGGGTRSAAVAKEHTVRCWGRETHGHLFGQWNTVSCWDKGTHGQLLGRRNKRSGPGAKDHRSAAGSKEHTVSFWGRETHSMLLGQRTHGQLLGQRNTRSAVGQKTQVNTSINNCIGERDAEDIHRPIYMCHY
jgi:hypothetical protein